MHRTDRLRAAGRDRSHLGTFPLEALPADVFDETMGRDVLAISQEAVRAWVRRTVSDVELRARLMRHGRWSDPRSLDIYLVDDWARHAQLVTSAA